MARGWHLTFEEKFDRFLNNVKISNQCWEWQGYINLGGYGRYKWSDRKNWLAHRLMYKLVFGDFDETLDVCHICDNTRCVRPSHLWLGTHTDNMQDMARKGRSKDIKGLKNPNVKLTAETISKIREAYKQGLTQIKLGEMYNVAHTTIGCIVRHQTWKHVNN